MAIALVHMISINVPLSLESDVDRVELFRLTSDFTFFDDASEFSVTSYVVFIFFFKLHLNFSSVSFLWLVTSSTVLLS